MNYSFWLSYRYLTAKKDHFLSVINLVSIIGVAIGVAALLVVIGVMAGFNRDLREKIIGTTAHIVVERQIGIKEPGVLRDQILPVEGVEAVAPYIHGNIFLEESQRAVSLLMRGVDPRLEGQVTNINKYIKNIAIQDLEPGEVVIGSQLARYFGYEIGDEITLLSPASGVSGEQWRYRLTIADIFSSGMYDYDMNLLVVHLKQAQTVFNLDPDVVSGLSIKLLNVDDAPAVKERIHEAIGFAYMIRTWIESNANFFAALQLEKFAMFIILTLIVLVASFNIVSTLIVTVTSKVKDIGILKSIGVPRRAIRKIFTVQGLSLGCIGTFWGVVLGFGICYALKKYQFIELPQEIYYIDRLPVLLELSDVLIIVGSAIFISYLATIYPAYKAAQLEPVEALRYE